MSNVTLKLIEAYSKVNEKKKLDPVDAKALKGKHDDREDGDIDNDGDEDESDEYLHNRRKAVKKAMGEGKTECPKCEGEGCDHCDDKGYHMTEEVYEAITISQKMAQRALASVKAQPKDKVSLKKAPWDKDKKSTNEEEVVMSPKKEKKGSDEMANEANTPVGQSDKMKIVHRSAHPQGGHNIILAKPNGLHVLRRLKNGKTTDIGQVSSLKLAKELIDEQAVNELSKATLGSYAKKAVSDIDQQKKKADGYDKAANRSNNFKTITKNINKASSADHRADNRKKGIVKAVDKLTREEVELPTIYSRILEARKKPEGEKAGQTAAKGEMDFVKTHTDNIKVNNDDEKGHDDAAKAGRVGPNAKARPNDNMKGDKKVIPSATSMKGK